MWKICLGINGWMAGKNDMGIYDYSHSIEEILDHAVKMGYDGIELCNISPDPYPEDLRDLNQIEKFKKKYTSRGLKIAGLQAKAPRTGASANEDERMACAKALLDNVVFAKKLGADFVGAWPAPRQPSLTDCEVSQRLIDTFRKFFKRAEEEAIELANMNIVVETEPTESFFNLTIAKTVLDEINHPNFKLLFDFAHINILTNEDPFKALRQFRRKIGHVHLADNDGTRWTSAKDGMSSKHLIIGEGNLNIKYMLEGLRDINYDGWIQIDVWQNPDPFRCSLVNKTVIDAILKNIDLEF
jgi:sugar phosphate isomerase/epimerase